MFVSNKQKAKLYATVTTFSFFNTELYIRQIS